VRLLPVAMARQGDNVTKSTPAHRAGPLSFSRSCIQRTRPAAPCCALPFSPGLGFPSNVAASRKGGARAIKCHRRNMVHTHKQARWQCPPSCRQHCCAQLCPLTSTPRPTSSRWLHAPVLWAHGKPPQPGWPPLEAVEGEVGQLQWQQDRWLATIRYRCPSSQTRLVPVHACRGCYRGAVHVALVTLGAGPCCYVARLQQYPPSCKIPGGIAADNLD